MITLTTYEEAREGFRHRDLRQALYDEGRDLMNGVIVNLHGEEHIARRRLENRLFRRDTFAWYENDRIPQIIDEVLGSAIEAGHGDLLPLARHTMMRLSIDVAGVDLASGDDADLVGLYALMERLARASTVAHATGDKAAIIADGNDALATFERIYYAPSLDRRSELVARVEAGQLDESELPRDVLTTLLRNQDRLDLPAGTMLREIAYFPWVGSHSTSAQLVHAMHHLFEWIRANPGDRRRLEVDDELRQRFVHESIRLHPASPVALRVATCDIQLKSGRTITAGTPVTINVEQGNRDPAVFGAATDQFDPYRTLVAGTPPLGLSFGHGTHACLAQELAGGLAPDDAGERHLLGAVALMAGTMLRAGAQPDPADRAVLDPDTTRHMWGTYPVLFDAAR